MVKSRAGYNSLPGSDMESLEQKILACLREAESPLDCEKIRIFCKIGNWNTALKHCLELLIQGRIKGLKTSKGWIFWIDCNEHQRGGKRQPWLRTLVMAGGGREP